MRFCLKFKMCLKFGHYVHFDMFKLFASTKKILMHIYVTAADTICFGFYMCSVIFEVDELDKNSICSLI